jgi:molybdenum cofactor cytidylyltransferase
MICAIVLAAGKSRRMGTQKLLLSVAGQPMIVHVINEVLRSAVQRVFVVTGAESHAVSEAVAGLPVTPVVNLSPDSDMLSSIRCGLNALPPECSSVLLVLGDQPGINAKLVAQLIAVQRETEKKLAVPVCQGRRGHPVLIRSEYWDEILHRHDGTGLRGLLRAHPTDIADVPVHDPRVLQDVDVPEHYVRFTGHPI